jgi:amino acid adenylation domain-containing protein
MSDVPGTLEGLSPARRLLLQRLLQEKAGARAGSAAPEIRRRSADGPLPPSHAQRRLWIVDRMEPGSPAYNVPTFLRLRGELDAAALLRAVRGLVARHEALRTSFPELDGEPVQVVAPPARFPVPEVDLRALAEPDRERLLGGLLLAEGLRPFDLERGPVVRASLVRMAPADSVLLFHTHHIVTDEWSVGVMMREVSALYDAFSRGEPSPLPEPEIQFGDYALWQREMLAGGTLEAQLAFWRGRLAGAPPVLELPTDRPRGAAAGAAGHVAGFGLAPDTARAVRALARAEGATLFMTLLAAWQALLARWSGADDVSVGTPVAGRARRETENLVGYLANTLVVRAELSDDPTTRGLLARVREAVLEAHARQDVPFERLVEELAPERSLAHTPLFQVMFSLETYRALEVALGPLETEMLGVGGGVPKFDLTLIMTDMGEEIRGRVSARAELFDEDTLVRLHARWGALVAGMAADPDLPVSAIPLLDAAERRAVLAEWNPAAPAGAPARSIPELFAEQAARTPDTPALSFGGRTTTYAELDRRSAALARELAARGVGPDARVGLLAERSPELVVAMLAVLRAGGAYVPLDPEYPAERLAFLLADAGARVLVGQAGLLGRVPEWGGEVVPLDTPHPPAPSPTRGEGEHDSVGAGSGAHDGALTPRPPLPILGEGENDNGEARVALPQNWGRVASLSEPGGGDPADASPVFVERDGVEDANALSHSRTFALSHSQLAYVIYTSGSTGTPKGVAVPHRAVVRLVRDADFVQLGPGDRVAQAASAVFDAATWEVWGALLNGGCVVGIGRDAALDARELAATLRREGVTALFLTTALFNQTVREAPDAFATLEHLLFGGEAVDPAAVRACLEGGPPRRLLHVYGPTENTTFSSWQRVESVAPGAATVPIGRAVAGSTAYLLDRRCEPVPVLWPGELYVGGRGVARGYLGRPGPTAAAFVPDPFAAEPGARMYRTGDRARWNAHGEIEFLGRIDRQVKVRGFRIEPGETEAALAAHPAVREAAVVVRGEGGDRRLAGFVTAAEGEAVTPAALRAWLAARLPEYMVPASLAVLDAMPLTPGGKLDRRALPEAAGGAGAGEWTAPRTQTEETLAAVWAEVLGVERVGAGDDFFALGGHSLLATRVASRVREAFGAEVPLRAFFEAPVLADLALRVDDVLREGAGVRVPPVVPVPRGGPLPPSFGQRRLWLVDQLQPGSPAYNVPTSLRVHGPLDPRALARALAALAERHEALRTVLPAVDGEPVQVVLPPAPVPLPAVDLRALSPERAEREALRLSDAEALRPFDLRAGPLLRSALLRLADEDWAVLFGMHHVVSDGWSVGVLTREVSELYAAFAENREPALPPLPVQYADYAAWQREWMSGEALDAQLAWWRGRLEGAPPLLELPTDRPRPARPDGRGAARRVVLPAEVSDRLRAWARARGATPFMALLAGWQALLARWSGADDVVVGTPVAGRGRTEVEGLIGFFVNTLVLRARVPGDETFGGLLGRVREEVLGGFAHQELPFERLVEALAPEREPAHTPVFQVMFALQTADPGGLSLGGARVEPFGGGAAAAKFDLALELADAGGRLSGSIVFRTELFDADTVERLAARYAALLEGALADPGRRLAAIPLLAAAERRVLLAEWGAPGAAPAPTRSVQELFAEQAARTPDAPALAFAGRTTTYAELDLRSAALARELAGRGVGPDARVGLLAERSAELVVGMLAILRAGGAYVPLDPEYPAERLAFLLADSGARVLAVQLGLLERVPDEFRGEVVALDTPHPPAPSPTRGEGEHDGVEDADALSHSRTFALSHSQLAYVIYTSGSTGTPKGVAVPHRGIVRLVRDADFARFGPGDRVAQVANPVFDAATWEIWGALLNGGCVVGIDRDAALEPGELAAALRREGVTGAFLTATLFNQTVREVPDAFATVTHLLVGGEALDPPSLRACLTAGPPRRLVNGYGPTENTTFSTWHLIEHVAADAAAVPIGRPVAGSTAYVLDGEMEPAPVGWPGELCVGGWGVARGYLGRPELTAERFVPDPFSAEPGARLYRTGDRARWSAQGEIEFLGRMDQQVKVRGFRVEPGEVEAALAAHPAVREAAVVVRGEGGDRRLAGFVTAVEGEAVTPAALRAWLAERLPEYMVPAAVAVLDAMPLTPGGKLDRRALPEVDAGADAGAWVAPRTPMEEILAGIWAAVLEVERVGATGNFFELGGHSLLATVAMSRVRDAFGVELPLRALFEAPTVAEMALRVAEARSAGVAAPPPIVRVARDGDVPVSFAQRRLWLIDRLEPGTAAWNMPFPLRLRGALDVRALERTLAELVRRHESLRTVFPDVDGEPVQRILPAGPRPLPVVDLRGLPAGAREAASRRLLAEETLRPIQLARGPLLRSTLLRAADDEWALLLTLHHIGSDGWSMNVLLREFAALYGAAVRGEPSPLPELPVQYADYAAWQRGWLTGDALEAQLAFWRGALAGAPPLLELPAGRPRSAVQRHRGATRAVLLPTELTGRVQALGMQEGTTPFMTLLAAFAILLARYTGETDVVVGTPIAGRTRPETEGLIGYFLNTLAVRTDLSGDPTFRELLGRVREATLGAYAHQDVPFEQLLEELNPPRSLAHAPVFQVMFNFLNFTDTGGGPPPLPGVQMEILDGGQSPARYDWNVYARETAAGIRLELVYDADLFEDERVGEALAHLVAVVEAAVERPELRVSEFPLAAPDRRRAPGVPAAGRDFRPPAEDATGQTLHARFAEQARLHPDRLAVRTRRHSLTYAELHRASDRAADALLRASPGAGERAALLFGHDAPMLTGILAALKAGKAYVPLDPSHPRERSAGVLDDSGASALLTDAEHAAQARDLAAGRIPVVLVDTAASGDASLSHSRTFALSHSPSPDSLAYLLYTSGSTGRPKGVAQSHRNVLHHVRAYAHNLRIGPDDVLTLFSSYTFDAAVMAIWGALLNGASLRPFDWREEDPSGAAEWMRAEGITLYHSTPTVFRHLVGGLDEGEGFPAVRAVVLGGEEAQRRDWETFRRHFPAGAALVNGLGPTESTVTLQAYLDHDRGPRGAGLPVGLPVRDTEVLLVNAAGEQPAVYGAGEIVVRGPHLALGYWGQPEATAAAFVPDPAGGPLRAYRTGDLGRRLPDGSLEFLGRRDFQVKVRGVRVEPGETEAALRAHPAVRDVVVAPRADASGERRLVAWLVAEAPGGLPAAAELRRWTRERVPEHMVPSAFVAVDAFPLTSTGKTDRLALPDPEPEAERGYAEPRSVLEEMVAGIFAEVLGRERVGIHDDFFDLGGHSLLATQVVARLRVAMGAEVPLRALFEAPTVAELAERVLAAAPAAVVDDRAVDEEMEKLAAMSDEEVLRLLRETES